MRIKKYILSLILLLFFAVVAHSQENRTEIGVDFRVNSTIIDSKYSNNAVRMQQIIEFLQSIRQDSTTSIVGVSFCGAASPEGSYQLNRKLARGRLTALEKFIRKKTDIPDSLIKRDDSYIPWNYLKEQIETSTMAHKNEIITILDGDSNLVDYHHPNTHIDNRIVELKKLDNGKVWQQIHKLYFERMRNAYAVFLTYKQPAPPVQEPVVVPDTVAPDTVAPVQPQPVPPVVVPNTVVPDTVVSAKPVWVPRLHIKTNAVALGMGIANLALEIDFVKHWSFALPVYYCAWDYFKETIKFRTFYLQPEVRYWLKEGNDGFFAGAHFGWGYYNFAFDGKYRYQDRSTITPAIGGGLSLGYRLPLSKNRKWNMEFAVGAGAYSLHYDKFYNTPNTIDGLMKESVKETYLGVDNAALTISYAFDLEKKGGKR